MEFLEGFILGGLIMWIFFDRPKWAVDAWTWLKGKFART